MRNSVNATFSKSQKSHYARTRCISNCRLIRELRVHVSRYKLREPPNFCQIHQFLLGAISGFSNEREQSRRNRVGICPPPDFKRSVKLIPTRDGAQIMPNTLLFAPPPHPGFSDLTALEREYYHILGPNFTRRLPRSAFCLPK